MPDKEPELMKELHRIRHEQYEETKNLPVNQWIKRIQEEAAACKKKHGLKLPTREIVKK